MSFNRAKILAQFKRRGRSFKHANIRIDVLRGLNKTEVGICDLPELQDETNQEYALLERCDDTSHERVLIRGSKDRCWIPQKILNKGFVWYAHSHPYDAPAPSDDDRKALSEISKSTGQKVSVVVPESRECTAFGPVKDLSGYTGYELSGMSDLWEGYLKG